MRNDRVLHVNNQNVQNSRFLQTISSEKLGNISEGRQTGYRLFQDSCLPPPVYQSCSRSSHTSVKGILRSGSSSARNAVRSFPKVVPPTGASESRKLHGYSVYPSLVTAERHICTGPVVTSIGWFHLQLTLACTISSFLSMQSGKSEHFRHMEEGKGSQKVVCVRPRLW